jgi:hypothetical protein
LARLRARPIDRGQRGRLPVRARSGAPTSARRPRLQVRKNPFSRGDFESRHIRAGVQSTLVVRRSRTAGVESAGLRRSRSLPFIPTSTTFAYGSFRHPIGTSAKRRRPSSAAARGKGRAETFRLDPSPNREAFELAFPAWRRRADRGALVKGMRDLRATVPSRSCRPDRAEARLTAPKEAGSLTCSESRKAVREEPKLGRIVRRLGAGPPKSLPAGNVAKPSA